MRNQHDAPSTLSLVSWISVSGCNFFSCLLSKHRPLAKEIWEKKRAARNSRHFLSRLISTACQFPALFSSAYCERRPKDPFSISPTPLQPPLIPPVSGLVHGNPSNSPVGATAIIDFRAVVGVKRQELSICCEWFEVENVLVVYLLGVILSSNNALRKRPLSHFCLRDRMKRDYGG